jgi:zinc/manganese transport system substrate-binding protein
MGPIHFESRVDKMIRTILFFFLVTLPLVSQADLRIFACEPEWSALAAEIGQDKVEVYSATSAMQDPHFIQARPSLIAQVRRADIVICSGAQLEIGWLPMLLAKANNPKVQPGNPGHIVASSLVTRLQIPTNVDRSQGDVHPEGNPHIQTNPHNIILVAKELSQRMQELDTENSLAYANGLKEFQLKWEAAIMVWEERAAPLLGKKIIAHHKSWPYLEKWLGMTEVANLEPLPGVPPSISYLSELAAKFSNGGADYIIRTPYQDPKASEWLSERSGIPMLELPLTIGGTDRAKDLYSMFDDIIDRLLNEVK